MNKIDKKQKCDICGYEFDADELDNGVCDKCLNERINSTNILLFAEQKGLKGELEKMFRNFIADHQDEFIEWLKEDIS